MPALPAHCSEELDRTDALTAQPVELFHSRLGERSALKQVLASLVVGRLAPMLAQTLAKVVGFKGRVVFDATKPDGTPRKLLDVSRLHQLGWYHEISLEAGLASTYQWFLENQHRFRG